MEQLKTPQAQGKDRTKNGQVQIGENLLFKVKPNREKEHGKGQEKWLEDHSH